MRPGAADFPTTECSAPEVECHSERRVPLSPSITSMTWLRDFCLRGRASHTTESLEFLPKDFICNRSRLRSLSKTVEVSVKGQIDRFFGSKG